jgi:hypothetical protein
MHKLVPSLCLPSYIIHTNTRHKDLVLLDRTPQHYVSVYILLHVL